MKRTSALLTALTQVSAVSGCNTDNLLYELDADKELLLTAISSEREALVQGEDQLAGDPGRQEPEQPGLGGTCDAAAQSADIFARYDEDRSGDFEEPEADDVAAERDRRGDHDRMRRREAWIALETTCDVDDCGSLDEDERAALLADFTTRCAVMQERLLADFDADGDGELSEEERRGARAALDADRAAHSPEGEGREGEAPEVGGPGGGEGERSGPPTADEMKERFLTCGTAMATVRPAPTSGRPPGPRWWLPSPRAPPWALRVAAAATRSSSQGEPSRQKWTVEPGGGDLVGLLAIGQAARLPLGSPPQAEGCPRPMEGSSRSARLLLRISSRLRPRAEPATA